ncbi:hypothetical protein Q1695_013954 [Nippostrongylus brasiliensis]|nr:hypothetical protein Q1695_013954 [Nippostrongylus brasiliensis]
MILAGPISHSTIEWKLWLKETGENSIDTCLSGYQNLTRNAISVVRSRVRIISEWCSITSSDSIDSIQLDPREQNVKMLPKAAVVIFLLAIIAVTLKTGEAGKAKPNEAPIPPPEKPPTVNTTETEHATFRVTWLPPSEPAGFIQKYKIRWKLERSPYTIYAEELCGTTYDLRRTTYDLRLYWAEERYQVFISAATSKGYGPEKRLDVAIGSPPDWIYRPKNVTTSTESANVTEPSIKRLDRRKFEAQLRAEIGHEYQVGRTRVLISIVFLLICLAFAYFLKTVVLFAPFPDVNRRGRNRRRRRRRKRSASKD